MTNPGALCACDHPSIFIKGPNIEPWVRQPWGQSVLSVWWAMTNPGVLQPWSLQQSCVLPLICGSRDGPGPCYIPVTSKVSTGDSVIIIVYSFMCYFFQLEYVAQYENQNPVKKACVRMLHAHTYTHTHTVQRWSDDEMSSARGMGRSRWRSRAKQPVVFATTASMSPFWCWLLRKKDPKKHR